jgi:hypothetical protein
MTLSRYFATPQHTVVVPGKYPFETPMSSNPLLLQPPVIMRKDSPTGSINSPKLPDVVVSQLLNWGKRYAPAISNESVESVQSVTQNEVSASNDARFGEQPSQKHILLVEDNAVNLRVTSFFLPPFSELTPCSFLSSLWKSWALTTKRPKTVRSPFKNIKKPLYHSVSFSWVRHPYVFSCVI